MADGQDESGDLTTADNFDINDVIDRARQAAEAEQPDDASLSDPADGPESDDDPGELTADDGIDAEVESEIEQDAEAPDEEPQPEPDAEGDKPEEPTKDAPPAQPDPRDAEIDRLKDLVAQSQQIVSLLVEQQTQRATLPTAPAAPKHQVPEEAVKLALFGGDDDAWKALPAQTRSEAQKIARTYAEREARAALDPSARFAEIQDQVNLAVADLVKPLMQDFYDRQAKSTFEAVAGDLKDPNDRRRLAEVYQTLPGSHSRSWDEQRAALETAAKLVQIERQTATLKTEEQRIQAKQRQQQANRATRLKDSGGGGGRRSAPTNDSPGRSREGETLLDYAARIKRELTKKG